MMNEELCQCQESPDDSDCGVWKDNQSLCVCADFGLDGATPG